MGNQTETLTGHTSEEQETGKKDFGDEQLYICNNLGCHHLLATGHEQWTLTNRQDPECSYCEELMESHSGDPKES